jgi:glycosyltransferase involved in cell wall biosynthesis
MLIVLTSHPIQYQAPLWRALAEELGTGRGARGEGQEVDGRGGGVPFEVWFLTDQGVRHTEDKDFGKAFAWDVDLLAGYPQRFLELSGSWDMGKFNGIPLAKPIGESLREAGATALWVEGWRFKPFWDAVSAAKKMGIPVFLRGETSDKIAEKGGVFGLIRNFALHRLFSKVDYFLAIGQASRRFYLKHGVPERKLVDAPYCVDNEFFRVEAGKIRGAGQEARGERREALGTRQEVEDAQTTSGIREEWKIPLDAKVVMFCGKFVGKKRPGDLVKAAAFHQRHGALGAGQGEGGEKTSSLEPLASSPLREAQQSWHLLFVGSGELGEELRAACEVVYDEEGKGREAIGTGLGKDEGRRQEAIGSGQGEGGEEPSSLEPLASSLARAAARPPASFVGFLNQSQISKAYAVADVVVLPSEAWETWGLVINEATAAGVPTVVSDLCGCSEDFGAKNPYTRVFPMGDVNALAAAIKEVLALEPEPDEVATHAEAFAPRVTAQAVAALLRCRDKWRVTSDESVRSTA